MLSQQQLQEVRSILVELDIEMTDQEIQNSYDQFIHDYLSCSDLFSICLN